MTVQLIQVFDWNLKNQMKINEAFESTPELANEVDLYIYVLSL